ncbi:hypothetical protein GRI97_08160 [Altererythrobacter xixiisoli]|uniref:Uncharacterized protein n=1 Tax=Croceibacterium xixiisoli TaxID=1476466 RepID=A0A6I4TUU4_9SPHN|nr:hypothetical protein [Croceibacterium xixiisoli]MXO98960.1 hypothetical protein [Croceibacterium xixiisoli]
MTDGADRLRIERNRERRRVFDMLARDKADRAREVARREAEQQVASGSFANLADTVIEPTPEWMAKGDTVPFTPKQPDGTVRVVRSVRRVVTPIVIRMWRAGRLGDDQARACIWYRECHDIAGLVGRFSSTQLSDNSGGSDRRSVGFAGHIPITSWEANARRMYREAKAQLPAEYIKFFEIIVLEDVAIGLATRFARCRNARAIGIFRQLADKIAVFCETNDIDYDVKLDAR